MYQFNRSFMWQSARRLPLPAIAICASTLLATASASADTGWLMHGYDIQNNAHAKTSINKNNLDKVALKSIYNIDIATAGSKDRGENAIGSGIAVTDSGMAYVPTTDGRIHVLDIRFTEGSNPDGTPIPVIVDVYDLVDDPRYTGAADDDGDDIVVNRIHPTLSGKSIYAANYNLFLGFDANGNFSNDLMGVPMLTNGLAFQSQGAVLMSIDKDSGELNWKTVIDDNPHSMVTNNPTVHKGVVYAALSTEMSGSLGILPFSYSNPSLNPTPAVDPFLGLDASGTPLPTAKSGILYRNSLVALDEQTGQILWKSYVMPEQEYRTPEQIVADGGIDLWNGASSWGGGNFPIDEKRGLIFMSTGEAYNSPLEADACEAARLAIPGANPFSDDCIDIDQHGNAITGPIRSIPGATPGVSSASHPLLDSVIALDNTTGEIRWARRLQGFDVWNLGCIGFILGGLGDNFVPACPPYLRSEANAPLNFFAKDLDIAEQPMLVRGVKMPTGGKRDLLLVTGKAANIWALDPDNGDVVWDSQQAFGPGSLFGGGIVWGSASDGERIYLTSTTSNLHIDDLDKPELAVVPGSCNEDAFDPDTGFLSGGIYGAVDLATGDIAWQRCLTAPRIDPNTGDLILEDGQPVMVAGFNEGPVSVAGGIVYVPGPTTGYGFSIGGDLQAQVIALDAKDGTLLRRFPLNVEGEPSATLIRFTRTAVTDKQIVIGNGLKDNFGSPLARRVVVYELPK